MKKIISSLALITAFTACAADPAGLKELTTAPARVVWVQDVSKESSDTFAEGSSLRLMGYCTQDRKGERTILKGPSSFARPLLTPDGRKVIFTSYSMNACFIVDFNGRNLRRLANGHALDVRRDMQTGIDWLYYCEDEAKGKGRTYSKVLMMPLSEPDDGKGTSAGNPVGPQPAWTKSRISTDNFQVSRDGAKACGLFPWPDGGICTIPDGEWTKLATGCWPSLSPDNSYLFWIFDGAHRNLSLKFGPEEPGWKVNISGAPGIDGFEVYHPRWSNHPRFMTITGPYKGAGGKPGGNRIRAGGRSVEVYVGRFAGDYRTIEKWCRISKNGSGDFFPDLWVENGDSFSVDNTLNAVPAASHLPAEQDSGKWPVSESALQFLWKSRKASNQICPDKEHPVECRLIELGAARYGRNHEIDLSWGSAEAENAGPRLSEACRVSREFSMEAFITPFANSAEGPASVICLSSGTGSCSIALEQEAGSLYLALGNSSTGRPGKRFLIAENCMKENKGTHIAASLSGRELYCFIDGRLESSIRDPEVDFSGWDARHLLLGACHGGSNNWNGSMEHLAMYSRMLDPEEILRGAQAVSGIIRARPVTKKISVEAVLTDMPQLPAPADIRPYRRCLVNAVFTVPEEAEGALGGSEICVALWGILDGTAAAAIPPEGSTMLLELEPFEDNPQLQGERSMESESLLDLYYDSRPLEKIPVKNQP